MLASVVAAMAITLALVLAVALVSTRRAQGTRPVVESATGDTRPAVTPLRSERPLRILLAGDSIMENTGDHLLEQLHQIYGDDVVVRVEGHNGSGLLTQEPFDWNSAIDDMLLTFDPDVVVGLFVGNYARSLPYVAGPDGAQMLPESEEYFAAWRAAAEDFTRRVVTSGSEMWWVTPPTTDRDDYWDVRTSRNAQTYREIAAANAAVEVIESTDAIGGPGGGFVEKLPDPETGELRNVRHSDRLHLSSFGGRLLARTIAVHVSDSATPPDSVTELPGD